METNWTASENTQHSNLVVDGLQQQKTTLGSNPVSQELTGSVSSILSISVYGS